VHLQKSLFPDICGLRQRRQLSKFDNSSAFADERSILDNQTHGIAAARRGRANVVLSRHFAGMARS
jgi:hypothetical protein